MFDLAYAIIYTFIKFGGQKMNSVYLAGPISGLSFKECNAWRKYAIAQLKPIIGINPLRAKSYLKDTTSIKDSYEEPPLSSSRGLTTRDYFDCNRADILIVNLLGTTRVSIGTCMEIAWAKMLQKPVILIIEPEGNPHDHAMIRESINYRVSDLDEAIHIAKCILLTDME